MRRGVVGELYERKGSEEERGWFNLFLSSLIPPFCLMSDRYKEMSILIKIRFSHHTYCTAAVSVELTQEMRRSNTLNSGWLQMILELGEAAGIQHILSWATVGSNLHIINREFIPLGNWIELRKLFKPIYSICTCSDACNAGPFLWCTWLDCSLKKII